MNLVGNDLLDSGRYIHEHAGIDLEPAEIVEELLDRVMARRRARRCPGGPARSSCSPTCATEGVRCALVTMSYRRFVAPILDDAAGGHLRGHRHRRLGQPRQAAPRALPQGGRRSWASTRRTRWRSRTPTPAPAPPRRPAARCSWSRTTCRCCPGSAGSSRTRWPGCAPDDLAGAPGGRAEASVLRSRGLAHVTAGVARCGRSTGSAAAAGGVPPHSGQSATGGRTSRTARCGSGRQSPVSWAVAIAAHSASTLRSVASRSLLVGGVAQHLAAAEVDQLQHPGDHAAGAPERPGRRTSSGTAPWPRRPRRAPCRSCSRPPGSRRSGRCRGGRRSRAAAAWSRAASRRTTSRSAGSSRVGSSSAK